MTSTPTKQTTTIKSEEKKKKTVFRQLLDSPFNLTWCKDTICRANCRKSVDQPTSNEILNVLCRYSLQRAILNRIVFSLRYQHIFKKTLL